MPHIYFMQGSLQTEPFKDKRLRRVNQSSLYQVITMNTQPDTLNDGIKIIKNVIADGWYIIVVLASDMRTAYVRREPQNLSARTGKPHNAQRGHSSVARGKDVIFAGEIMFVNGELLSWNCKTGHYFFGSHLRTSQIPTEAAKATQFLKCEDGSLLLPVDKRFSSEWEY